MAEQVQPDKIKLLTPQQVAALGPAKVAALADVCLEWGPLSEADRARALADLEPLQLGKLLTQRTQRETSNTFWVYLPPVQNRADADRRAADAKAKGLSRRGSGGDRPAALRRVARRVCRPRTTRRRGSRRSSRRARPAPRSARASR